MQPFRIDVPQATLDDLNRRLATTRWPAKLSSAGWDRGVPLDYLKELTEYWRTGYDWHATEERINAFPQYVTDIDGTRVHFLHVRSPRAEAIPILLTHGWPGSFAEFLDIIEPLADPGPGEPAFHLVVPSLPGYGFSGPTAGPGWDVVRTARAWAELMRRLGYDRYLAQGGDFGSVVSLILGQLDRDHVLGVHINMLLTGPSGDDPGELVGLSASDQARLDKLSYFRDHLSGYMAIQSTRPQTLSYALTDSPVGQLAWIVEKFWEWTDSADRPEEAVNRDLLLTNVMVYWLTATAGSSAQLYYEIAPILPNAPTPPRQIPSDVPLGVAVFPHDMFLPVRRFAERDFTNIVRWSEFDRGGHFAAMEEPDLLVADLRGFARALTGQPVARTA